MKTKLPKPRKHKPPKVRRYDNPTLKQAQARADWPKWEAAIKEEYDQMIADGVYITHIGQLPLDVNLIGSMLVLQIKRNPDGTIDKYKARLVAIGNQQKTDSYKNISSATPRTASVKMLISLRAKTKAYSSVLDVKGAYLKSDVRPENNERLFFRLPNGEIVRLKKYLYGLK